MGLEWLGFSFVQHALLFGVGALLLELAPARMRALQLEIIEAPLAAGLSGLLASVVLTVSVIVTAISLVGIPLTIALAVAWPILGAVGLAAVASVVGHALPIESIPHTRLARLAAGVGVLLVTSWVPVVGHLLWVAAACVGLGALVRTRFQATRGAPAPVPGGPYRAAAG